jgi:hypothetical protein
MVAIDTNISGNDDTTVGTIEDCAEIGTVGDTLTFDLVVVGVDVADRIKGYQFDIDYDPAVIRFGIDDDSDGLFEEDCGIDLSGYTGMADWIDNDGDTLLDEETCDHLDVDAAASNPPNDVTIISRLGSGGGVGFLHLSDTRTGGSATLAAGDGTAVPAPPANHEYGDGVLARFTVTAVGTGTSPLLMPSAVQDADVINGGVDIDDDGDVDSDDDGTLANAVFGFDIVDGGVDVDGDGNIDTDDDGFLGTVSNGPAQIIDGGVDVDADGDVDTADDGRFWIGGGSDGFIDTNVTAGDGTYEGNPIPITTLQSAQVVVGGTCGGNSFLDTDSDGFVDGTEGFVGTDPVDSCADTLDPGDEVDDKWPADFDDNRVVNITDVFQVLPPFYGSAAGNSNYSQRRDLDPNGVLNITDIFRVLPLVGFSCTDEPDKPGNGPKK